MLIWTFLLQYPHRLLLAFLNSPPIRQQVTFKLASLVNRSLHEISPTCLSSLLHSYAPTQSLRSSYTQLLAETRLKLYLFLLASDLPNHEFGTLSQMISTCSPLHLVRIQTQNSPLYFNSSITVRRVNFPRRRLWFDVKLDFAQVINLYITIHQQTKKSQMTTRKTQDYFRT